MNIVSPHDPQGFPDGSEDKESACNAGGLDSISVLGRSPGEGHGNSLQYSCLKNPMDRGAWEATVHGVAESQTRMNNFHFTHYNSQICMLKLNPQCDGI